MRYALTEALSELFGVDIKERGVNALLLCPFHEERSPSFSIHLEEGVWHCFGCGKKGGLQRLYREMGEVMDDSLYHDRLIKSLEHHEESRKNFYDLSRRLYSNISLSAAQEPLYKFIKSRNINRDAIYHFKVGFNPEISAIAFPYWDHENKLVTGIKYRLKDGGKRAENGSIFNMYNIDDARGKNAVIICEGESDTLCTWSYVNRDASIGVIGISGAIHKRASWERWSLDMMFASRIYLALDADETGDAGAAAAIEALGEDKCVRLRPTHGKDMSEHIANGGNLGDIGLEADYVGL